MKACDWCRTSGGNHQKGCPNEKQPYEKSEVPAEFDTYDRRKREWRKGYEDGRARKKPQEKGLTYRLGWVQGDSAADEAANG